MTRESQESRERAARERQESARRELQEGNERVTMEPQESARKVKIKSFTYV